MTSKEARFLFEIGSELTSSNPHSIQIINIKYIYKTWINSLEKDLKETKKRLNKELDK